MSKLAQVNSVSDYVFLMNVNLKLIDWIAFDVWACMCLMCFNMFLLVFLGIKVDFKENCL